MHYGIEKMTEPRVFKNDALSIIMNGEGISVYAGTHKLKSFKSVDLHFDGEKIRVSMSFSSRNGNDDHDLKIEQETRLLSSFNWLDILPG